MNSSIYKDRLSSLRSVMEKEGVDGFIIPRADEYQGEYVPECADRMRWISGFTGSAGVAVVLKDVAAVLSDGRYTIQLRQQLAPELFEAGDSTKVSAAEWIKSRAPDAVIGFDPRLHTPREVKLFADKGVTLKPVANLVDAVWDGRPAAPCTKVEVFPLEYAGLSVPEKLDRVAAALKEKNCQAAIVALPDSIAWLLNIRSSDIPHIPVALSYAIVFDDGTLDWFIDDGRIGGDVKAQFGNHVRILAPLALEKSLQGLQGKKTLVDERRTSVWFTNILKGADVDVLDAKDPCIALKACKNLAEIKAMQNAHERDGAAVTNFLAWLDGEGANGGFTEIDIEKKLEAFRRVSPLYRDSSFDTISGFGGNGAIVHYRATEATNKKLEQGNLLLLDSGAQYADGTTDITRTMAIGTPTEEMCRHFTMVLKGHIGLATAKFPAGTTGAQVDVFARKPLWAAGMDYAHGTGHGVGVYLSVHEESASISPRGVDALEEGMILSNEPGYYREGEYGIRIENLILVKKDGVCADTGKDMLSFETLTFAPIDPALVDFGLLTDTEKAWLKSYHLEIQEKIGKDLTPEGRAFLTQILKLYA